MREFPYACCRCGFCCMSETCPVGQGFYGVKQTDPCPALYFDEDQAGCQLADAGMLTTIGIGTGCDIKARAFAGGIAYDFAGLPPATKHGLANRALPQWIKNGAQKIRHYRASAENPALGGTI